MSRPHVLVEIIRLVHPVHLGLLRVKPALQQFGIVPRQVLISLFYLAQLELQGADLVM